MWGRECIVVQCNNCMFYLRSTKGLRSLYCKSSIVNQKRNCKDVSRRELKALKVMLECLCTGLSLIWGWIMFGLSYLTMKLPNVKISTSYKCYRWYKNLWCISDLDKFYKLVIAWVLVFSLVYLKNTRTCVHAFDKLMNADENVLWL